MPLPLYSSYPPHSYQKIEMRSATIALLPFLFAERDRAALLQMRRNRDAEADLMKNVEGWEVGTYMGEPIYKTIDEDGWHEPKKFEYFEHSDPMYLRTFADCHLRR
ncbi:hypothetical protein HAZT_HAZT007620 [Hyalella azteca]|uniref:NADH dehydrogenase [ubiquinone] 1 alpha subcomplex subunit 13 n=1 Tax=Hyalella azteca TaxID=294128 RepID=A0A6A0GVQ5_HYAAZ|nr:hypothetical protein HAZT_HAZT007620 [Hyalella azteca]